MFKSHSRILGLLLLSQIIILYGCAATLAPQYDQAVVDGLNSVNYGIMELMASVSGGTVKDTFAEREDSYNGIIGHLYALEIQAKSRPMPSDKASEKINKILTDRGIEIPVDGEAPSVFAVGKIAETIIKMRDTDKKQGITEGEAQAFKNQAAIFLDQAMTYENFLKR